MSNKLKTVVLGAVSVLSVAMPVLASADEGEVMGGNHQPPTWSYTNNSYTNNSNVNTYNDNNYYAEDNQVMTIDSIYVNYPNEFQQYDYQGNYISYGYYGNDGYWYNYSDDFGYRMYNWNDNYYYY